MWSLAVVRPTLTCNVSVGRTTASDHIGELVRLIGGGGDRKGEHDDDVMADDANFDKSGDAC